MFPSALSFVRRTARCIVVSLVLLGLPTAARAELPWWEHSIARDESLFTVASRYGVSTQSIAQANELIPGSPLQEGQMLLVPKRGSDVVVTMSEVRARKRGETVVPELRKQRNILPVVRPAPSEERGDALHAQRAESFIIPVAGGISSRYGKRGSRFHDGIDIPAPAGTAIVAAKSGIVVFSGRQKGYGNTVTINHGDGTVTRYSHNSVNLVKKGERVKQGQPIAKIGRTGRATCNHLHLSLFVHGKRVNPEKYFPY